MFNQRALLEVQLKLQRLNEPYIYTSSEEIGTKGPNIMHRSEKISWHFH